jgi:hypothetical protein
MSSNYIAVPSFYPTPIEIECLSVGARFLPTNLEGNIDPQQDMRIVTAVDRDKIFYEKENAKLNTVEEAPYGTMVIPLLSMQSIQFISRVK